MATNIFQDTWTAIRHTLLNDYTDQEKADLQKLGDQLRQKESQSVVTSTVEDIAGVNKNTLDWILIAVGGLFLYTIFFKD
jgi:hypothetical protein